MGDSEISLRILKGNEGSRALIGRIKERLAGQRVAKRAKKEEGGVGPWRKSCEMGRKLLRLASLGRSLEIELHRGFSSDLRRTDCSGGGHSPLP